jgi:glycosyltransferase involved in cell wall biosynthesis
MKRPIRVLELRSIKGKGGGPDKTILLGAARADRRQFEITVTYLRDVRDREFVMDVRAASAGVDYAEVVERHSLDWSVVPALRRLVRSRAIDVVHAHDYKTDWLTYLLARTEGTVPLSTAHGWSGHGLRERLLYYPVDKRILRRFQRVIVVSRDMARTLHEVGVHRDRIVVLRNGIDHVQYRRAASQVPAVRRELGFGETEFVVGAVGRLEREKRYDLLIDACAAVARRCPQLRLVIVGEGSLRSALAAQMARVLPANSYQLLGHRTDVIRLHHGLDVLVQSSDNEGSPNAILESMALETPVVATAVGGTADLIQDERDGLLVPRGDVTALANAIERSACDESGRRARAVAARAKVVRELSFDTRQRELEAVYRQLMIERSLVPARAGDLMRWT